LQNLTEEFLRGRIRIVLNIFGGVEIFFDGVLIAQFVSPYCTARVANVIDDESLSVCVRVRVWVGNVETPSPSHCPTGVLRIGEEKKLSG
jgi:hypothetical protein